MQQLYAMSRDVSLTYKVAEAQYYHRLEQSYQTYLFNVLQLVKIAEYAKKDAARKAAKLLPSAEDKAFLPTFATNLLVKSLSDHTNFLAFLKTRKLLTKLDPDFNRQMYMEFSKTDVYQAYIKKLNPEYKENLSLLLALLKYCDKSESYNEFMEDRFVTWEDDNSLVMGTLKKTIKLLPTTTDFHLDHRPDKETTEEFGGKLLNKIHRFDKKLLSLIVPTLKNWEADRVAVLDMILIKMALCEMMYFPTIPTKVTINEYIDISKLYSTPKSKNFINGVLDRLLKQLIEEGDIVKLGRGLIE